MLKRSVLTGSRMTYSRLIGALFLSGFLFYGVGSSLVTSVVGAPDFLSTISAHQTTLVLGAFLMLLNTAVDVGKGVLFFPILEKHGKRTALAYLAALIVEVVLLDVGVLALLMIVPLAQQGVDAGQVSVGWAKALGSLAVQSNTMAYQIGQMSLGLGAVFLCLLPFRTRLSPDSCRFGAWSATRFSWRGPSLKSSGSTSASCSPSPVESLRWGWDSGSSSRVSSPRLTVRIYDDRPLERIDNIQIHPSKET